MFPVSGWSDVVLIGCSLLVGGLMRYSLGVPC